MVILNESNTVLNYIHIWHSHLTSKVLNSEQRNFAMLKKELLSALILLAWRIPKSEPVSSYCTYVHEAYLRASV